jgi:hypothetical protein
MVALPYWTASGSPDLDREAAATSRWGKKNAGGAFKAPLL